MIKFLTLFVFIIFSFFNTLKSQESKEERMLNIKGGIVNMSGKVKNAIIRIIHDDGVVDTIVSKKGKYNLHLEVNHKILIEFISKGHYTKRVGFNTEVPKTQKSIPLFDLTINLVETDLWQIKEEDEDVFDLLVPYLTYNSKKKMWYDQNSKYNRVINKKIKSLGIY
jgi:hypothetical protein